MGGVVATAVAVALLGARALPGLGGAANAAFVRVPLPEATRAVDLPKVEGPQDASRPLVVIDAGHGGHDPGASSDDGLREKALTLALARAIRSALLEQGGLRVALTRSEDRFLVLDERAQVARRLGADLFISIHADAAENNAASGATVYTLSDSASDAFAERLAQRENRADTVNGIVLGNRSDAVSTILVDLSRREMRERSIDFARLVLREGEGRLPFHENPWREAAFVVLKSLDLPSALVEAGYLSNAEDAARLRDPAWQRQFARILAKAAAIFVAGQEGTPSAGGIAAGGQTAAERGQ